MKKNYILILLIFFSLLTELFAESNFVSLKNNKVNVRHNPTLDSPIKYIYKKINLPVKVIDKKENFRRVIDLKNNTGWIHLSQLKKNNSLITLENKILFKKPTSFSKPLVRLEKGRLLIVKKCLKDWCNISTGKFVGWIKNKNNWGKSIFD